MESRCPLVVLPFTFIEWSTLAVPSSSPPNRLLPMSQTLTLPLSGYQWPLHCQVSLMPAGNLSWKDWGALPWCKFSGSPAHPETPPLSLPKVPNPRNQCFSMFHEYSTWISHLEHSHERQISRSWPISTEPKSQGMAQKPAIVCPLTSQSNQN